MPSMRGGGHSGTVTETAVSGTNRYKFFKRPIMPRVNAYPPHFLLAPTANGENNPLEPNTAPPESATREMAIQTMYRDSEAQTNPYTPNYVVPPGQEPEILLLKNMTYDNGLPMGEKEMAMIEFARAKREMEMNLPPFTDEASLNLRKRLMESQEMREFHIREQEIDALREEKLQKLQEAIQDREESNEFMTSQRLESVRLLRMEEREKVLEKIRIKRIKALRRLAHQRNVSDPILSESASNGQAGHSVDIIDAFFDRGSQLYAPMKRDGKEAAPKQEHYDIASRTAPLDNLGNLLSLEYTMPRQLLGGGPANFTPVLASQTMPAHMIRDLQQGGNPNSQGNYRQRESKIKAAEPRMTSAAARAFRQTKRDVEEMHLILTQKKRGANNNATTERGHSSPQRTARSAEGATTGRPFSPNAEGVSPGGANTGTLSPSKPAAASLLLSKKPKARPPTPDITRDRADDHEHSHVLRRGGHHHAHHSNNHHRHQNHHNNHHGNSNNANQSHALTEQDVLEGLVLLQRLVRGRAVQNIMFEGKYRRRELIAELQAADLAEREQIAWARAMEAEALNQALNNMNNGRNNNHNNNNNNTNNIMVQEERLRKAQKEEAIRESSLDAVGGAIASQITQTLAMEKLRADLMDRMQAQALRAITERRDLEAAEAGRRQREGLEYPTKTADGIPIQLPRQLQDNDSEGVDGGTDAAEGDRRGGMIGATGVPILQVQVEPRRLSVLAKKEIEEAALAAAAAVDGEAVADVNDAAVDGGGVEVGGEEQGESS